MEMSHDSRWSFAYWTKSAHAMEERMYASQRLDVRARVIGFEASTASLRSRVNSGHCACALA
jgi:hypothetical protein